MSDAVFWLGLLLAPLAAVPTRELLRRRPRSMRALILSSVVCMALFVAKLVLGLRFRDPVADALSAGVAFAAVCALASCSRNPQATAGIRSLASIALASVVLIYILVLVAFGFSWVFAPREPASIVAIGSGFVCRRGNWAIPGDGGTWATLYMVLPYAPFLMRDVDSGSASDNDGGFGCADALEHYRARGGR